MKARYSLFLTLSMMLAITSFAQKEISLDAGYGLTGPDFTDFRTDQTSLRMLMVGLNYTMALNKKALNITTGINMLSREREWYSNEMISYLHIPAGLEYFAGRKLRFVTGGGLYLNLLVADHDRINYERRKYVLGGYGKIGAGYQITENYSVMLSFKANADITHTAEEIDSFRRPSTTTWTHNYFDKMISVSVYYRFKD